MKKTRPQRSRSTDETVSPWNDPLGFLLLIGAAMFMLALLSYDPGDLPGWAPLVMSDQANTVTRNFIGQTGAIVAGYSLFLMGMATYLVPISLMWFGVCKLANKNRITRSNWLGVVILVVAGASLLQVNGLFSWRDAHLPHGGGGALGSFVGDTLFMSLFGRVGATLVLGLIYLGGLILAGNLHPLRLLEELRRELPRWIELCRARYALAIGSYDEEEAEEESTDDVDDFEPPEEEL